MRKTWVWGGIVMSCALGSALGVQAQNTSGSTGSQQQGTVTVTGCVRQGGATGATSTGT
jgi:hypothetical protein